MFPVLLRLPPWPIAAAILLRGVVIWAGLRLGFQFLGVFAFGRVPGVALALILLVGILGWIEAERRNEVLLLANLGVGPIMIIVLTAGPAVVLELLLRVALSP